ETNLHPGEIVGVDLLAIWSEDEGRVDTVHARPGRDQWLAPGDTGFEAGEAAGILRRGALIDPALGPGVVGRAAHDIRFVVRTGRLAFQLEFAARHQSAELRRSVE